MAQFKMENDQATVIVDEHASEIHSFQLKQTDFEYMWQGDSAFWSGRNPTLFPLVGSTYDKKLHIDGKVYDIGNHGFTRHSDFTCIEHTDNKIVMELKDSEETLKQYPYHFTMHIIYELKGSRLSITYEITNENEESMPFGFGLHPAFNCPVDPSKKFEDYHIEFSNHETFEWKTTKVENSTSMPLNKDALADTVILTDPFSSESSLTDGEHGVTVTNIGYKWLAYWSPKAPFVCIEPWHSHTDFEEVKCDFKDREGTIHLDPHRTFTTAYTITVF